MLHIVFIEAGAQDTHVFSKILQPRLGLPLLGAILCKLGHKVKIFCEDIAPVDWNEVKMADIVGISTISATALRAYEVGDRVREMGIPVIMGGVHPTFVTEESLRHCDWVVRGEGEETLPELLEIIAGEKNPENVLGLSWKKDGKFFHNPSRPLIKDLDALPFPDLTLIEGHKKISPIPIVTSRGCPFDCTFCSVTPMFGRGYRYRSPENVLAEIKEKNPKKIFFCDDMFNANRSRMLELCRGIIDWGLKLEWMAQVRTNVVKHKGGEDTEALELMRKSGCSLFYIGLESVNPETLKDFKKHQGLQDIKDSIRIAHKYDIGVHGMFVLGSDSDDENTVLQTLEFALKQEIDTVQILILTPYPGTEDTKKLEECRRIVSKDWNRYDAQRALFIPDNIKASVLQQQVLEALKKFYRIRNVVPFLYLNKWWNRPDIRWKTIFFRLVGGFAVRKWMKQNKGIFKKIECEQIAHLLSLPPEVRKNIKGSRFYDL